VRNLTMTTLQKKFPVVIAMVMLSAMPLGVSAAGLGKLTVLSVLGQTLRAEVDITASVDELSSLAARVASPEAFRQGGIEYSSALTTVRLAIEKRSDGRPFLSMVSDRPFNEPFLDLLIELDWKSGRLVREYTFLLDPPESLQRQATPLAAPVAAPTVAPAAAAVVESRPAAAPTAGPTGSRDALQPQDKPLQPRSETQVTRGAEAAQRGVKADPVPPKAEKESAQRLVKRGDTLSQIANETKPEGVNLDQMLVALFRGNQDAFEGNVNRLKAGKILAIPNRDNAVDINPDEARKTVAAHAVDFHAYSKKLAASVAGAAAQKGEAPTRAVSGKIAPKVEEKLPAVAPSKDKLEVSKSEAASGAGKAGAGRLAAIEETLIAREKALKEANSRIAELEKNLNDLKKLIELKNQGMAELQKQAQVAKPAAAAKPAPEAETKKSVAPVATPVAKSAEMPAEKSADKPAEKPNDKATETPKLQVPAKPAAADNKPAPPPPAAAQPEASFVDESPEVVYGGAGILALLLFYFGYKRYMQRRGTKQSEAQAREPSGASRMGAPSGDSDTLLSPTDFSDLSGSGAATGDAGVDPVAEADVYLAYGRDVQAEEILLDALKTDPTRHAIHLKLLEIYANRKSNKPFESIATDLHNQTGGSGPDWETAAKMGQKLDPSNPLYGPLETVAKVFDPDATLVISPEDHQLDMASLDSAGGGGEELLPSIGAVETPVPEAAQEEMPASLDFELDLAAPEPAAAAPLSESAELDIDLGRDAEATIAPDLPLESGVRTESVPPEASSDFDLDLDLGPKEAAAAVPGLATPAPTAAVDDAAGGLDFNFDLDAGEPAVPTAAPAPEPEGNSMDFDLETPAPAAPQPAAPSVDLSSISLELGEPAEPAEPAATPAPAPPIDDAASQDVETKLELAQAYEEMGDKEGARELLQEVLSEGNVAQKETARSKLERLE